MDLDSTSPATDPTRRSSRPARRPLRVAAVGIGLAGVLTVAGCAAGQVAQTAYQKSTIDGTNETIGTMALRALAIVPPTPEQKYFRKGSAVELTVVFVNQGSADDTLTSITGPVATGWSFFASKTQGQQVLSAGASASVPASSASPSSASPSSSGTESPSLPENTPSSGAASESTLPASPSDSQASTGGDVSESPSTTILPGSESPSGGSSSSSAPAALPTGTQSVTVKAGERVAFATPEATGSLLLTGLTRDLYPGNPVRLTFTFAKAGTRTFTVPVQIAELSRTAEVPGGGD